MGGLAGNGGAHQAVHRVGEVRGEPRHQPRHQLLLGKAEHGAAGRHALRVEHVDADGDVLRMEHRSGFVLRGRFCGDWLCGGWLGVEPDRLFFQNFFRLRPALQGVLRVQPVFFQQYGGIGLGQLARQRGVVAVLPVFQIVLQNLLFIALVGAAVARRLGRFGGGGAGRLRVAFFAQLLQFLFPFRLLVRHGYLRLDGL